MFLLKYLSNDSSEYPGGKTSKVRNLGQANCSPAQPATEVQTKVKQQTGMYEFSKSTLCYFKNLKRTCLITDTNLWHHCSLVLYFSALSIHQALAASKFRRMCGLALPSVFSRSDQLQVTNIKDICSAFLVFLKEIFRYVMWNTVETLQRSRKGQSYNRI